MTGIAPKVEHKGSVYSDSVSCFALSRASDVVIRAELELQSRLEGTYRPQEPTDNGYTLSPRRQRV